MELPRVPPNSRFVVYKLPAHSGSGPATQKGLRYKYLDADSGGWQDGVGSINSSQGAVGRSLLPLYRNNASQVRGCLPGTGGLISEGGRFGGEEILAVHLHLPLQLAFLLYNDQPPKSREDETTSSHGHTKGEALGCPSTSQ